MFISCRSEDRDRYGTLLHTDLARRFGADQVLLAGESVTDPLERVRAAQVVVAVIGPSTDQTCRELAEAFTAGVPVLPVLVDGATLPAAVAAWGHRPPQSLRSRDPHADLDLIADALVTLDPDLVAAGSSTNTIHGPVGNVVMAQNIDGGVHFQQPLILVLVAVGGLLAAVAAVVVAVLSGLPRSDPQRAAAATTNPPASSHDATSSSSPTSSHDVVRATTPSTSSVPIRTTTAPAPGSPSPFPMTLQMSSDHGGTTSTFTVSGTGCHQGDQVDIAVDDKVLVPATNCEPDNSYRQSYTPDGNGRLTWVDAHGTSYDLTLVPGTSHSVQAHDHNLDSPRATYQVG